MEMFENISEVVANIGRTALFGFCASLPLDVITAWNDKKKPSPQRLFVIDFAYCLFVALAFFVTLLVFAEGRLRVIWFVSAFVGVLVYRWLIGSLIRRTSEKVISWITAVSLFVRKCFFAPIGRFLKKIIAISLKPLKFLIKYIKIILSGAKSAVVRKRISGRKRKWLRKRNKTQKQKASCRE